MNNVTISESDYFDEVVLYHFGCAYLKHKFFLVLITSETTILHSSVNLWFLLQSKLSQSCLYLPLLITFSFHYCHFI